MTPTALMEAAAEDPLLDALLAAALLFAVVAVPPLVGIRTMYTNCWLLYTLLAHVLASEAMLGLATSMGITIMVGWYTLRIFDRSAFTAILNGWLGVWASSRALGVLARLGDLVGHLVIPMVLISCYLPFVRVWMSVPALISSRLWSHFVVGGGVFPTADHIYRFSPPRSAHFWNAAYKMELMLNMFVPLFCVLAHQRSFWVYLATALAGGLLFSLQLIRSLMLPKLRRNAKTIMCRLLTGGGIRAIRDFDVRDDAFWLDWMSDGLVAIGESYVGGLWTTNSTMPLEDVIASLMTIPMEARREMYRSWNARIVALAARLFKYAPSSVGLVVGAASEQFDLCPDFRRDFMDRYYHQGFGIWTDNTSSIEEAQTQKLEQIAQTLDIQPGHRVLDVCIGSWGGVGCYLAEKHPGISVVSVLSSIQEHVHAVQFARELGVLDRMEFILADSPIKLVTTVTAFSASRFDRIVCIGAVETLDVTNAQRFLRSLRRVEASGGSTLIEFVACTATYMTTHAWNNKYIHSSFPCYAITLPIFRALCSDAGFTLQDIAGYSAHFERTFIEWNRRFQAQWSTTEDTLRDSITSSRTSFTSATSETRTRSLPESFKRTWEFYLLHSAACFRVQALQVYQVRMA